MILLIGQFGPGGTFPWREFWTVEAVISILGCGLLLFLGVCLVISLKLRKSQMLHEEQMLALERGLVRPEGLDLDSGRGRRTGWAWVAVGVPFLGLCAVVVATIFVLTWYGSNASLFNQYIPALLITFWIVSGVVSVAAVVMGSLGLLAEQRLRLKGPPAAAVAPTPRPAAEMFVKMTDEGPVPEKSVRAGEQP